MRAFLCILIIAVATCHGIALNRSRHDIQALTIKSVDLADYDKSDDFVGASKYIKRIDWKSSLMEWGESNTVGDATNGRPLWPAPSDTFNTKPVAAISSFTRQPAAHDLKGDAIYAPNGIHYWKIDFNLVPGAKILHSEFNLACDDFCNIFINMHEVGYTDSIEGNHKPPYASWVIDKDGNVRTNGSAFTDRPIFDAFVPGKNELVVAVGSVDKHDRAGWVFSGHLEYDMHPPESFGDRKDCSVCIYGPDRGGPCQNPNKLDHSCYNKVDDVCTAGLVDCTGYEAPKEEVFVHCQKCEGKIGPCQHPNKQHTGCLQKVGFPLTCDLGLVDCTGFFHFGDPMF